MYSVFLYRSAFVLTHQVHVDYVACKISHFMMDKLEMFYDQLEYGDFINKQNM